MPNRLWLHIVDIVIMTVIIAGGLLFLQRALPAAGLTWPGQVIAAIPLAIIGFALIRIIRR